MIRADWRRLLVGAAIAGVAAVRPRRAGAGPREDASGGHRCAGTVVSTGVIRPSHQAADLL
jgi:hypothetical protein